MSIISSSSFTDDFQRSVWEGNRDFMITGAWSAFKKYPLFGTTFRDPLFVTPTGEYRMATDVTAINILARNGLIGFIILLPFFSDGIKF